MDAGGTGHDPDVQHRVRRARGQQSQQHEARHCHVRQRVDRVDQPGADAHKYAGGAAYKYTDADEYARSGDADAHKYARGTDRNADANADEYARCSDADGDEYARATDRYPDGDINTDPDA
jgi:hypothetical protein